MSRTLFIGNPTARSGQALNRMETAYDAMNARGWAVDMIETLPNGATVPLVRSEVSSGRYDRVVYLGGDGTFSEVAKGILLADGDTPALGMLPAGTANDQGKSFGIRARPKFLEYNLDIIEAGHLTWLDVGRVDRLDESGEPDASELVFHSVGWGFQSDILHQRNLDREEVQSIPLLRQLFRDQAIYAGATLGRFLASWVEPTRFDAVVTIDGEVQTLLGLTDIVCNFTAVYGGAWVFARDSEPDDGQFEFLPVFGRRDMAIKALTALKPLNEIGLLEAMDSDWRKASTLEVRMIRPGREQIESQIDGEEWLPGSHFRLITKPRFLPLITPAEFDPPWR